MEEKSKRSLGTEGEGLAKEYLIRQGFQILEMNYRVGRKGEIDIIAREKEYLCFVEVKTRKNNLFGSPSEAVNGKKQDRMIYLSYCYMKDHHLTGANVRFDVVEILYQPQKGHEINLIRNAF